MTAIRKERVVVICPGRGTYTKETLGYLKKFRPGLEPFFAGLDQQRKALGEPTLSELDNEPVFKPQMHTKGEHASSLIYACSYADFLSLDRERFEVVAVTGNSMGWYIALAVAGVLRPENAFTVINTMGSMMKEQLVGGQIIYPLTDAEWRSDPSLLAEVEAALAEARQIPGAEAHWSIHLGGYAVLGGNQKALDFLLKRLPKRENYPFQLINHAAFHTPMLNETSQKAFAQLPLSLFDRPQLPLVDGRGHLWMDYATDLEALYDYTLGHQVTEPYDFTAAVTVCLKEFCPDKLILLGPGNSLGGALGQILIENNWKNLSTKSQFSELQARDPFLISLGRQL